MKRVQILLPEWYLKIMRKDMKSSGIKQESVFIRTKLYQDMFRLKRRHDETERDFVFRCLTVDKKRKSYER